MTERIHVHMPIIVSRDTSEEGLLRERREDGRMELAHLVTPAAIIRTKVPFDQLSAEEWKAIFEPGMRATEAISELATGDASEERLRQIYGDEGAKKIIAEGTLVDVDGSPKKHIREYGITLQEVQATRLYFGLLDGEERNALQVAEVIGVTPEDAEAAVVSTVRKLRRDPTRPVVLPKREITGLIRLF